MRAAALSFDVRRGEPEHNRDRVLAGLEEAARRGVQLLVLPEMWPTSFPVGIESDAGALEATARQLEVVRDASRTLGIVVVGSALGTAFASGLPTNRLHVFDRGREVLTYDKVHLFSPTAEDETFTAGEHPPPTAQTEVGRLSGVVCYDLRFPEVCRVPFRAGVEVLCVPAQWPRPRAAHWRLLVRARALEAQCFVVAANRCGVEEVGRRRLRLEFPGNSLVVSPDGEVLAEGTGKEGLVLADIDLDQVRRARTRVPVAKDERPDLYRRWLP